MSEEVSDIIIDDPVITEQEAPTEAPTAPTEPKPLPKDQVELIQKKAFGYAMQMVDEALREAGFDKPENVKSTDYIKQILTDKGTKSDVDTVKTTDDDSSAKIKALQDQLRERDVKLTELSESTSKAKRDYFLSSIIEGTNITAPEGLGEAERIRYTERIKKTMAMELNSNYLVKEVEGQFRFYQKDGTPIFDGSVDMNHIKPTELLKRDFSEFLTTAPQKTTVKGTGGTDGKASAQTDTMTVPSKVKDRYEFFDYLQNDKGFKMGSKEFTEAVLKAQTERPNLFK